MKIIIIMDNKDMMHDQVGVFADSNNLVGIIAVQLADTRYSCYLKELLDECTVLH